MNLNNQAVQNNNNSHMRYRQQKNSSVGTDESLVNTGQTQFNTIRDAQELAVQMSIRTKKNQQYVSMNAT